MKFTLLEMTQEILSALDSDEVNSIDDTVESMQVATLIRSVFFDLAIDLNLPEHEGLFQLDASGDPDKPTLMTVPDNVAIIRTIKYNIQDDDETTTNYSTLIFKPFEDFIIDQTAIRDNDNAGQMTFEQNGEDFDVAYIDDKQPQFFTTPDDYTILFDSYDSDIESTLQKSKTMCMGVIYPTFSLTDTFTPDLDPSQFSLLKNRAKVRAFAELKQMENREAIRETQHQKILVKKRRWTVPGQAPVMSHPRRFGRGSFRGPISIPRNLKQGW